MRRMATMGMMAVFLLALPVAADDDKPSGDNGNVFRAQGGLLDRSPKRRPQMLSVFLGLPYGYYYYGFPFGIGGRYLIPLVHDGFIPALNDEFSIEFGLDLSAAAGTRFYSTLGVPVELMWNFHFSKKFAAYVKAGAVLEFNFVPYVCTNQFNCGRGYVSASPIGNLGLIFRFSEKISFRAEVGYPWVKIGLGFDM